MEDGVVLDGATLQRVNQAQGYRYRARQTYLQEDDRVAIIRRLLAGEKQSDLSREFGVTRAAISNTFKNRDAILARSRHVYDAQCAAESRSQSPARAVNQHDDGEADEVATPSANRRENAVPHRGTDSTRTDRSRGRESVDITEEAYRAPDRQDRERRSLDLDSDRPHRGMSLTSSRPLPSRRNESMVHIEAHQSPAAHSLVTQLQDPTTLPCRFRPLADRLIRLVLDEVAAFQSCLEPSNGRAVAVGVGHGGYPLLRCYQTMHPNQAVGLIRVEDTNAHGVEVTLPPAARTAQCILLMTSECRTGTTICRAISELLAWGIDPSAIALVAVLMTEKALVRCERLIPVYGFVGAIVPSDDGVERFVDRYYHADAFGE